MATRSTIYPKLWRYNIRNCLNIPEPGDPSESKAAKREVESNLVAQIQSYAKERRIQDQLKIAQGIPKEMPRWSNSIDDTQTIPNQSKPPKTLGIFGGTQRYPGYPAISQEHSAELKDLALEDAVKSTLGQKKQLEAGPLLAGRCNLKLWH